MSVDFNQYVGSYREQIRRSQSFAGADHGVYLRVKANVLKHLVAKHFGDTRQASVLDVGCGMGLMEPYLVDEFDELVGVDPADQAVEYASDAVPGARFETYNGRELPFPDRRFDVVFAACVLHHVAPLQWPAFLAEMERVLKPGGMAVTFEHNPYNPLTRLAVARCDFDRDAVLLTARQATRLFHDSGLVGVNRGYLLFLPLDGPLWSAAERALGWLPMAAQYYVAGAKAARRTQEVRTPILAGPHYRNRSNYPPEAA